MLYEIPETLTLFILASPDCVKEYEVVLDTPRSSTAHNDEAHSLQVKYRKDALSFVETVEQFRNPFGPGHELVALDIHVVMEKEVIISLSRVHQRGEELHPSCTIRTLHRQSIKWPCQCQTLSDVTQSWHSVTVLIWTRKETKRVAYRRKHDSNHTTLSVSTIKTCCRYGWLFFAWIKRNHQVWQIVAHFEQARSRTLWNALKGHGIECGVYVYRRHSIWILYSTPLKNQLVEQVQPD